VLVDFYVFSFDCDVELDCVDLDFGDECDLFVVFCDDVFGGWLGLFVMVSFNMCIVRCSNVL